MTVRGTGGPISMFLDWPVNEEEHLRIHRDGRPITRTRLAIETRRQQSRGERWFAALCCKVTIGHCWHPSARKAVTPAPAWFCCECPADRWSSTPGPDCKVCVGPGCGVAP